MGSGRRLSKEERFFQGLEPRQAKLVGLCFDACIRTIFEHAQETGGITPELEKLQERYREILKRDHFATSARELFKDITAILKSGVRMEVICGEMTSSLRDPPKILHIEDPGPKDKRRLIEKAQRHGYKASKTKDANRLSVVASDPALLDRFERNMRYLLGSQNWTDESWEIKKSGFLCRTGDAQIDGFSAEVQMNEPRNFLFGKVFTHSIYEVTRVYEPNEDDKKRFEGDFQKLPKNILQNIKKHKDRFSQEDLSFMTRSLIRLNRFRMGLRDATTLEKHDALVDYNRYIHEVFIGRLRPEWKEIYQKTEKGYTVRSSKVKGFSF